ncbi:hypothetical protein FSP39_020326 [Pinctada imbricata]|uniref:Uncharacterized protein n=1 Tax=Pinctada imbricata TaxID=66713 RepID=A0AA88YF20_PINIB|nr:hypothetical protein FSP39_020326 [Pinctada imbricata]
MLGDLVSRAFAQAVDLLLTRHGSSKGSKTNGMSTLKGGRKPTNGTKLMIDGSKTDEKSEMMPMLFSNLEIQKGQCHHASPLLRPSILMQDTIQQCQRSRSFQRQVKLHSFLMKEEFKSYIGQLGHAAIFSLYASVCGVSFMDGERSCDTVVYEWKVVRDYLTDDYHHYDVITSRDLRGHSQLKIVKVVINLSEYEMDYEFEYPERQENLKSFSKLVFRIVPKPSWGEQLMCYVKGDEYVTGKLKHYFIRPVFSQASVVLGSRGHVDLQTRLDSCKRLQDGFDASIDAFSIQLAEAGYYLTTDKNLAQCFECGGILQLKNFDFDVWRDHAYWHPSCPYLIEKKGREFVEEVRSELRKACDFNKNCVFTFKIRTLAAARPTYRNDCNSESSDDEDDSDDDENDNDLFLDMSDNYTDSGLESDEELDFDF